MAESSLQHETRALESSDHLNNADSSDLQPSAVIASLQLNDQNATKNSTQVYWRCHKQEPSNADNHLRHLDTALNSIDSSSNLHPLNNTNHLRPESPGTPLSAGLRIHTDISPALNFTSGTTTSALHDSPESPRLLSKTSSIPIARTPSVKKAIANSVGSAASSVVSSPMLNAMADLTPLPSPLFSTDSPGPWKKQISRPVSRDVMLPVTADSALVAANGESINSAIVNAQKRRLYNGLMNTESNLSKEIREKNAEGHNRNRSISEYIPESLQVCKQRHVTVSGSHDSAMMDESDSHMRREPHLAAQRGLAPANEPLTPPRDSDDFLPLSESMVTEQDPRYDYFEAWTPDNKKRRWKAVRLLGEGTFSKVMLATSQVSEDGDRTNGADILRKQRLENEQEIAEIQETGNMDYQSKSVDGYNTKISTTDAKILKGGETADRMDLDEIEMDPKKLVAIKICEHGPVGGLSEERHGVSVKRELDFLKSVHHPSLVNLKAWSVEETRAILVLNYCAGGDLFDVASEHKKLLIPSLVQRMFSELVGAVRYLHESHIVHRDIKLENILVNLPQEELAKPRDWKTYPFSVITLTDLGLSRRVTDDEKLMTRCGSDDYAAPEVIMGQTYDGRMVDAWSLGVVLYALLESRLPFDPPPNASAYFKQRSKTSHRIARVEWKWYEYHGEEGDYESDPDKFEKLGLLGAMRCTEALLRKARIRASLDKLSEDPWIKEGICVEGGIRFREEDVPDEI